MRVLKNVIRVRLVVSLKVLLVERFRDVFKFGFEQIGFVQMSYEIFGVGGLGWEQEMVFWLLYLVLRDIQIRGYFIGMRQNGFEQRDGWFFDFGLYLNYFGKCSFEII